MRPAGSGCEAHRAEADFACVRAVFAAAVVAVTVLGPGAMVAGAQVDAEQELADRYAPIVMLKDQEGPCDDSGEPYEPMAVDVVLDNPLVVLRQVGPQDPVLMQGPGAADVFGLGESVFLDFPGSALKPGCVFEKDLRRFTEGEPAVVYAHVVTQEDEPGKLALQYWFFWYYNDWNNKHEGDWEGIQLLFDAGSVEEALQSEPVSVGYAQHEGGERADWDDEKLERRESRPVVYPSAGSHASYFTEALYLGRSGSEGFGCDNTVGPSTPLDPQVVVLPDAVDDPNSPLAWLAFEGRWGERQSGPFNGPTGPALKGRWTEPVDWHEGLRSRSVVVPGDEGPAQSLVFVFCDVVEFGSAQLIALNENPALLLIGVVTLSAIVTFLLGRTDWSPVRPLPIVARRHAGQLIRAAFELFRRHIAQWVIIGLVYFPITLMVAALLQLIRLIPFIDALLEAEADVGFIGVVLATIIGAAGHFLGVMMVGAGVAVRMRELETDDEWAAAGVYGAISRRFGDLLFVWGRVLVTITVLVVSIVGIPWAVRLLIRYHFAAPVAMLEDVPRGGIMKRSSELVSGRVAHTGAVVILLNALVVLVAILVGLVLLILLSGIPLWLFSVLISASSAITAPYVAIAVTLLYGDARAEAEDANPAPVPALDGR